MIAAASSTVRVLVGTTEGPSEIISLHRESAAVRRSIICVGGKRAGIDRGYNEFVSRKTGVIERAFGSAVFRIDVSHPIDAGSSWQLGFFVAHALSMAHRLAVDDSKHDVVVWATGRVRNSDLSVGGIGYVAQKLNLSLDRLRAEALAGNRVFVVLPAANSPEIDAELQRSLEATGARLLEIENVGQLLRELALPPVTLEAAAVDKVWSGSPFRGLEPFEFEHREIYYGRGRAREEALERLRRTASRGVAFLLIHGRSGAGKSSLVRAGLIGDIHRSVNAAWRQSIFTPLMDGSPLRSLGRALISGMPELSSFGWDEDRLVQSLLANNADVIDAVRKGPYQLLLFVDQLDELLLWANENADDRSRVDEREAFADTLLALCRTGVVWTISTLRSDLLALLEDSPALSRLAADDRLYRLERPTRVELKEIIVRPAQAARLTLDGADPTGLPFSEVLIETASTAPDSLPLLQFVLARLFELEGTAGRVTFAAYDRLGRLEGAIGRWAEDTVQTLVDQGVPEKVIEQAVLALSQIDRATGTVSARLVPIGEDAEHKLLKNVLVELTRRRLVVIDESGKARVAHEAVLTHWPRAKTLFEAASRDLSSRDLLEAEADNWWHRDCDMTLLILAGRRLSEAEELRSAQRVFLSEVALKYLAACQVADRLARIRTRRVQAFIYVLLVGIIAGLVGWINQSYLKEQINWYLTMRPYMLASVRPYVLTAETERALKPGQAFRECAKECPEMIVIPAGSFMMGSAPTEKDHFDDEGPQHQVTIARPFAVAKFELTFDEWDTCATYGDCNPKISDTGYGRGRQPVINVTWDDAQIYVEWLKRMTGKPYRLLTEAEYEYAARAGTATAYPWGEELGKGNANCIGCGSEWAGKQPAPVGSFAPNQFGLYDMVGNVFAWVEDCAHANYNGAPEDGTAWVEEDCHTRVLRSGSWGNDPQAVRAAFRNRDTPDDRIVSRGFRVARTLTL